MNTSRLLIVLLTIASLAPPTLRADGMVNFSNAILGSGPVTNSLTGVL